MQGVVRAQFALRIARRIQRTVRSRFKRSQATARSITRSTQLEMANRAFAATRSVSTEQVEHNWFVVDAADKTLGRLASEIAHRLRGKHKAEYTPHVDTGDYIVVVNAEKIRVTGAKATDKIYHHHTGYPGALKSISFEKLIDKAPVSYQCSLAVHHKFAGRLLRYNFS